MYNVYTELLINMNEEINILLKYLLAFTTVAFTSHLYVKHYVSTKPVTIFLVTFFLSLCRLCYGSEVKVVHTPFTS